MFQTIQNIQSKDMSSFAVLVDFVISSDLSLTHE